MHRKYPKFTAKELHPLDQFKQEITLHIKVITEFITTYRKWLKDSPGDWTVSDYMKHKLIKIQKRTGGKFHGVARESVIVKYYLDTILKYANLPKDVWVNKTYPHYEDRILRKGHLEDFRELLKSIMNQIENEHIKSLIDKLKEIFFIIGDSDREIRENVFEKAKEWREVLVSLITLPNLYYEESKLPFLTDEAMKVLFSVTKQFNSAYKKYKIPGDYRVPIISNNDLLGEWDGLRFQEKYKYILQVLGFRTDGTNWFPSLDNLPTFNENLITILEELDLCEITSTKTGNIMSFTLDSYSLHLIYYSIILKNLNLISDIAETWIAYYFTRVIYSYYKAKLEANVNPLAHLMEEANFRERIFIPLWKIIAGYLPIPHSSTIRIEKEWLHSSPKETDDHIKRVLDYIA